MWSACHQISINPAVPASAGHNTRCGRPNPAAWTSHSRPAPSSATADIAPRSAGTHGRLLRGAHAAAAGRVDARRLRVLGGQRQRQPQHQIDQHPDAHAGGQQDEPDPQHQHRPAQMSGQPAAHPRQPGTVQPARSARCAERPRSRACRRRRCRHVPHKPHTCRGGRPPLWGSAQGSSPLAGAAPTARVAGMELTPLRRASSGAVLGGVCRTRPSLAGRPDRAADRDGAPRPARRARGRLLRGRAAAGAPGRLLRLPALPGAAVHPLVVTGRRHRRRGRPGCADHRGGRVLAAVRASPRRRPGLPVVFRLLPPPALDRFGRRLTGFAR